MYLPELEFSLNIFYSIYYTTIHKKKNYIYSRIKKKLIKETQQGNQTICLNKQNKCNISVHEQKADKDVKIFRFHFKSNEIQKKRNYKEKIHRLLYTLKCKRAVIVNCEICSTILKED